MQRQLFPFLEDYAYQGVHMAEDDEKRHELLNRFYINLFKTDGLNFDGAACVKDKEAVYALCPDKPALFSYEYAVGVLFGYPDAVTKAERLFKVFGGQLKIVMIVREQKAILSSQYRDHPFEPHDIHRGKPVSFEQWYKQTNKLRFFRFTDLIHYERLVRIYDDLFGPENVLVLPMELMAVDPTLYARKMADFLGVDEKVILLHLKKPAINTGHSAGTNRLRRLRRWVPVPVKFSELLPRPLYEALIQMIKKGTQEKVEMSKNITDEIDRRYEASNKKLEERMGVPLEPLGYAVEQGNEESEWVTVESPYGVYTGYKNDRAIVQTQKFGAHTRPELSMVLSFIKGGDTVLDIGAHIGTFAVPLKNAAGPEGKLIAFEANPRTVEMLEKNIKDNGLTGEIFNNGVSSKSGSLFVQERKNKYKSSGSDFLVDAPPAGTVDPIEVQLIKVDDVVTDLVDFIKIDVEGMELDVLKSAVKTIDASRPVIYSEYVEYYIRRAGDDPAYFERFFKERNYHFFINGGARNADNDEFKLVRVPGPKYIRRQIDFLLIPTESERYPSDFVQWYKYAPLKFLWWRFQNVLKDVNAVLKIK